MTKHWTHEDIGAQQGRVAIVTGSNSGLGKATARHLVRQGATVVLACRDDVKAHAAQAELLAQDSPGSAEVEVLDLASLTSIRAFTRRVMDRYERLDLLINNAGVMMPPLSRTEDGFELQLGVNHLGHFALTGLLLERLRTTPGSRVVTVSSLAHRTGAIDFDDLPFERNYGRAAAYARSKLANLLFTYALQDRLARAGAATVALAAHPGGSRSELARNSPLFVQVIGLLLTPVVQHAEMGALPTLRAATDPAALGGQYYGPGGFAEFGGYPVVVKSSDTSRDPHIQRQLWEASEQLTGVTYPL